jgi:hypothetical protein
MRMGFRAPDRRLAAGACVSLFVAMGLFLAFGWSGDLSRDESVYAYAGQQLVDGTAPYLSIFDPKGPVSMIIAGIGVAMARVLGFNDLLGIRLVYFACSCATVLAVYALTWRLWRSLPAAVVAGCVFASFEGFARDALSGPDAKTPGVLFLVLTLHLTLGRQWFWAALVAAVACLTWQPFVSPVLVLLVVALVRAPAGERIRILGLTGLGAGLPTLLILGYLTAAGALGAAYDAAVVFPLRGITHAAATVSERAEMVVDVLGSKYHFSAIVLVAGLVLLLALAGRSLTRRETPWRERFDDPVVHLLVPTFVSLAVYTATDFQGYPDVYPLLPYAALGLGGVVAGIGVGTGRAQRFSLGAALAATAALVAWSAVAFAGDDSRGELTHQRQAACGLDRLILPGTSLWALGDPTPLVLTGRRNPDRFIFVSSGVGKWKIAETTDGLDGWKEQMRAADPSVVMIKGSSGPVVDAFKQWLKSLGYAQRYVGPWKVMVSPNALEAAASNVRLTAKATEVATGPHSKPLPADPARC